jgi:hypothetical protein
MAKWAQEDVGTLYSLLNNNTFIKCHLPILNILYENWVLASEIQV